MIYPRVGSRASDPKRSVVGPGLPGFAPSYINEWSLQVSLETAISSIWYNNLTHTSNFAPNT
ncbi:hypothetical protein CANTEDRAFT_114609, partial [Yamadazyma tenuis ATCC 10573]